MYRRAAAHGARELAKVRAPVLVAVGGKDRLAGNPQALADAIPGACALTVPGCSHLGTVSDKFFKGAVLGFFGGAGRARG